MILYPAIDLYEGKVVRLKRGDYAQKTIYSDDPVSVALGFKETGATALHIIDLEGALNGKPKNADIIKQITKETGLFVQVGGGIRTPETIEDYLKAGVKRLILGTAVVSKPELMREMVSNYGEAVAVSVDIKDGFAAVKGWTELSDQDAIGFCSKAEKLGVRTLICTDISKDGMQSGTNIELYKTLRQKLALTLIASGGVTSINEIKTLSDIGMDGAILGKALYTGNIDLKKALQVTNN